MKSFSTEYYSAAASLKGSPNFKVFMTELDRIRADMLDSTLKLTGEEMYRLQGRCAMISLILKSIEVSQEKLST